MSEIPGQESPQLPRRSRASKARVSGDIQGAATDSSARRPAAAKSPAFFVALAVLLVVKAWLMRGFALGAWNPIGAIEFETAFVVLVLGLFDLVPPRRWYWLDLGVYTLLSVLLFAMTVYTHFYEALFDPHMMAMAGQLGSVSDAIAQLIKPVYVLFLLDVPFLAVWIVMIGKRDKKRLERYNRVSAMQGAEGARRRLAPRGRSLRVAAITIVAAIVVAAQLVTALQVPSYIDGVALAKSRGLTIAQAIVFFPHDADSSADNTSTDVLAPGETASNAASSTSAPSTETLTPAGKFAARVERIRGSMAGSRIATFPVGAYAGKNLIIIQVEALDDLIVGKTLGGQEITPNINKLIQNSWYFPNTYSETGIGNTADAEFIVNSSLYAPRAQAAPVAYAPYQIPALPRILNSMGYDTFTMHPNKVAYWNRKELYGALGFRRYYDAPFYHYTDIIGFGASDEVAFRDDLKVLKRDDASSTPFYSQIITLSGHTPFQFVPASRRPFKTPSQYSGFLGDYMGAQSYGDKAIGGFIDSLKKTKLWNDSIIVIYGDHTWALDNSLEGNDAKAARALLGRNYDAVDRQRIPLIIHLPGQTQPVQRQDTVGDVDIMPTVADLLGIDLTQVPHMGRSVFVNSNSLVPENSYLPGGSFLNGRILFMPGLGFDDGTATNIETAKDVKPTDADQVDYKRMLQLEALSDKWVRSLPKRTDAGSLGDAWIPNEAARKAGASLGAKQLGTGSVKH